MYEIESESYYRRSTLYCEGSTKKETTFDIMKRIPDIDVYGMLLSGDVKHPLSKVVTERFYEIHNLTGENFLLFVFNPPNTFHSSFKEYWKSKLGENFDKLWDEWPEGIENGIAYSYGDLFKPKIKNSEFPCLILFVDLENIENQRVIKLSIPNWGEDDLFKYLKDIVIESVIECGDKPKKQRLDCLQHSLNSPKIKVETHFIHIKDKVQKYINENPCKVVVATAGFLSALATGNILPLGGPAIAFLDLIRGNK